MSTSTALAEPPFGDLFVTRRAGVNGLELSYTEWNPGETATCLLVHGLHVQSHVWDPIAAALSRHYRVICPDLRGHGDSDWARDGYWTRHFVSDLHSLLEAVGCGPVMYVGHSLGARIGYALGATHPDDLLGMVLADTAPETPRAAAQIVTRILGNANAVHGFRSREDACEHYSQAYPEWQPVFHRLHALYQLRENWASRFVNKHDPDLYWITRSAGLQEVPYLWDCAARIPVKTWVMWGERSPYLDKNMLERVTATIPHAQALIMPAGHAIPREIPDEFVERVLDCARSL